MVNLQRDNLLGIANSLNEAVFNQNMWGHALQHMADCFGGSFATFEIFNRQTGLHSQHFDSSDIEIRDEYLSHYMPLNPRIAFGNLPDAPSVMHDHLFMGENDMDRCEFYADFLSEFDLRYFLAVKAFESKDEFGVFTIQKSASGGGATNDEIHAIHNLAPFLNNIAKFQLQQGSLFRRLNDLECLFTVEGPEPAFRCKEIRQKGPFPLSDDHFRSPCRINAAMLRAEQSYRNELRLITIEQINAQVEADDSDGAIAARGCKLLSMHLRHVP